MIGVLLMSSERLGPLLNQLKARAGTWRSVARKSGLSVTYVIDLANGDATPRHEKLSKLAEAYPDVALELYEASGLEPPARLVMAPTEIPPGARHIVERGETIPLGPNVSAHGISGGGDEFHDSIDVSSMLRGMGADYALEVTGECLEPLIHRGDMVAVKRARTAGNGDVVVARAMADGYTGELGEGYTLKVLRKGNGDPGFYRADGTRALSSIEAKIVGKVVGVVKKTVPSFK